MKITEQPVDFPMRSFFKLKDGESKQYRVQFSIGVTEGPRTKVGRRVALDNGTAELVHL